MEKIFTCSCGDIMLYDEKNITEIYQKHYGKLEIDSKEKDVIIISNTQKTETNLIQIEREKLPELIKRLKQLIIK